MATTDNERHLRYILLLVEGGTDILREILNRETEKEKQNSGKKLDQILKDNETKLQLTLKDKKQQEKLFPTSGVVDTNKWDISLLATVILQLYGNCLTADENECIKQLRKLRNDKVAHTKSLSMNENDYNNARNIVTHLLIKLSNKLDPSVHNRCQEFIKKFNTGSIDIQTAIERVKNDEAILKNIQHLKERVEKIEEKVNLMCNNCDKIEEIHQLLQKQRDQEAHSFAVLGTKMMLKGPDAPLTRQVEALVTAAFSKALKLTGGDTEDSKLTEAVKAITDKINDLDCKVSIKSECIRMSFQCKSCKGLLQLLEYLQSNAFRQKLLDLVLAVEEIFGGLFHITFEIERDSLEEMIHYFEEDHSEASQEERNRPAETVLRQRPAMLYVAGGIVQRLFDQRLQFLVIGCSILLGFILSNGLTFPAAVDRQKLDSHIHRLDIVEKELSELHKKLADRDILMSNMIQQQREGETKLITLQTHVTDSLRPLDLLKYSLQT